jgi:UDP-glucuronate 4-epimerase
VPLSVYLSPRIDYHFGMATLITGGAGFIGSHLLDFLLETRPEAHLVCLDNFDPFYDERIKRENLRGALASGRVTLVEGDIRDLDLCRRIVAEHDVDAVVHLAALAGVRPSIENPLRYEDVNCRGTLNLLEVAREAQMRKFVFGSSSSIYGLNARVPFCEDDPTPQPISPYAATKRAGELMCHVYHHLHGLPVVCLRFFNVYGPRQRPDLALPKFARLIAERRPVPIYGDGSARRDYTYCSDVVEGVAAALDRPFAFEIINLGNESPVTVLDLLALIESAMGIEAKIEHHPAQPGDVPVTYADIGRARKLLGYDPRHPIADGVAKFVEWFADQAKHEG